MKEEKIQGFMPVYDEKKRVWKAYRWMGKKLRWVYVGKDKSHAEFKIITWCQRHACDYAEVQATTEPSRIKWLEARVELLEKQLREKDEWLETKIHQQPEETVEPEKQKPICGFSILQIKSRGKLYWYAIRRFANATQHKIYLKKDLDRAIAEAKIRKYCWQHNLVLDKA